MSDPDFDAIRSEVQLRVEKYGLRRISRQIGMSASGLHKFIGGSAPYEKTRRRIIAWCERFEAGDARSPQAVLVDELLHTLPDEARDDARKQIMRIIASAGRQRAVR